MNITNAQYQNNSLTGVSNTNIIAIIDGVTCHVPCVADNRHYAEIMRQVDAGELTIAPAEGG